MSDNVQVAVRVRPFNSRETGIGAPCCISMEGQSTKLINPKDKTDRTFNFDHSFWSHEAADPTFKDQEDVFKALGLPCLENSFQGYNACIFAYGQTGSGKTHTMIGHDESNPGLIPRLCTELFERVTAAEAEKEGLKFKVEVSYMELYNEHVYDLLSTGKRQALKVRQHKILGPYVEGLKRLAVTNYEAVDILMEEGNKSRTTAETKMNATSSRSHAVFSLHVTQAQYDPATKQTGEKTSKISLVDLAGSERQTKTQATGARLKEGSNINKSLTTLGQVIHALAGGEKFVPYRDSILTFLLKDSLGGNSKTLMVAAISPAGDSYEETLSTLRFADRAKAIKNHAVVNEDPNAKLIRELREELERLRAEAAGRDPAAERDNTELEAMRAKLAETEGFIQELSQSWEEKLKTTQSILEERQAMLDEHGASVSQSGDALVIGSSLPHFLSLLDDPFAANISLYTFKEGITTLGSDENEDPMTLTISGLEPVHCTIEHKIESEITDAGQALTEKVTISPIGPVLINGAAISETVSLSHGSLVKLNDRVFRFSHPTEAARIRKAIASGDEQALHFARTSSQASLDSATAVLNPTAAKHQEKAAALEKQEQRITEQKKKMVASKWKLASAAEKTRLARQKEQEEQKKLMEQHRRDAERLERERAEFEAMKQKELDAQRARMAALAKMGEESMDAEDGFEEGEAAQVAAGVVPGAMPGSATAGRAAAGQAGSAQAGKAGSAAVAAGVVPGAQGQVAQAGRQGAGTAGHSAAAGQAGQAATAAGVVGAPGAQTAQAGSSAPRRASAAQVLTPERAELSNKLASVEAGSTANFEPPKPEDAPRAPPKLSMWWETDTDKKYKYKYCSNKIPGDVALVLWVQAPSDAHIALTPEPKDNPLAMYELVIGCNKNTEVQIRRSKQGKAVAKINAPLILSEESVRSFWIISSGGNIMIGLGEVPGKRLVLNYADPEPLPTDYVGVSTGWGSAGQWKFAQPAALDSAKLVQHVLEEQRLREGTELFKDLCEEKQPLEPYWAEGYVFHTIYSQKFNHEYYAVVVTGQHVCVMIKPHVHTKQFSAGLFTSLLDTAKTLVTGKAGLRLEAVINLSKVTNIRQKDVDATNKLLILEAAEETVEVPILPPNGDMLASCIVWLIRRVQRLRSTHAPAAGAADPHPQAPTRKKRLNSTGARSSPTPQSQPAQPEAVTKKESSSSLGVPSEPPARPRSPGTGRRLPQPPGQKKQ